ncbi:SRPBCC family protein [Archangium gephyra]|uniref:SRPBCC family protein n=1 Tax=Archangium gephyra TaxID=48 RepID=UPI003B773726
MSEAKKLVLERTYRASVQELWELWTTKEGFESWWGPEGFRVEVHEIDARLGGTLRYDMIAHAPEVIQEMKKQGEPLSHATRGTFSELEVHQRLTLTHVIDFIPGVKPYESTMVMELFPSGNSVRMVVTLSPMHNPEFTQMQLEGFTSQLTKLDKRFGAGVSAPARDR